MTVADPYFVTFDQEGNTSIVHLEEPEYDPAYEFTRQPLKKVTLANQETLLTAFDFEKEDV